MDKIYKCACHGHMLEVDFDEDLKDVSFLFWERTPTGAVCLRWRIKQAWEILTKGRILHEECILSFKDANDLSKDIKKKATEWNKEVKK